MRQNDAGRDQRNRPAGRFHSKLACGERQHGRIRHLKKDDAADKHPKGTPAQKHRQTGNYAGRTFIANAAMGAGRANLAVPYVKERCERRERKPRSHEKDGLRGDEMSKCSHDGRRRAISSGCKTGVAAQARWERAAPDQAKAYRCNRRSQQGARYRLKSARGRYSEKDRHHCDNEGAEPYGKDGGGGSRALRTDRVDKGPGRDLAQKACESPD